MSKPTIIFNHKAAERSMNRFTWRKPTTGEHRLIRPRDLFLRLSACGAITKPTGVSIIAEEHGVGKVVDRVRFILTDHSQDSAIAVTSDHSGSTFLTEALGEKQVLDTVAQLVGIANDLLAAHHAMKIGRERIACEVDYSDPANLIVLLENRDCKVIDPAAVQALVAAEPGPRYYGDIDVCENGGAWEDSGARWADKLERRLAEQGAIKQP
jgi:hypothetical protein